jgi:hypothetical protein
MTSCTHHRYSGSPGDLSHGIEGRYVRPWSLDLLFCRRGFGLVVSVVVPLMSHCVQSSRVLVPAGTSKSMLRRHGIQAVTRVMAYVTHTFAVTL